MTFDLNGCSVLITGGTGTLGSVLAHRISTRFPHLRKLIVFSRDEYKQFQMARRYPSELYPFLHFVIGDVRDSDGLKAACRNVDYVIHTAAMKHVSIAEDNPEECIKTNIGGAQNLIKAVQQTSVKCVIALSTDKASSPSSLYGATKLASEKLFVAANTSVSNCRFSIVRLGNIMSSSGSVVPCFLEKRETGELPITSERMTRFHISAPESAGWVLLAMEKAWGGEVFVPKMRSFRLMDLAEAVAPGCKYKIIGLRPGEKFHEEAISSTESGHVYDCGSYYVIVPPKPVWKLSEFLRTCHARSVPEHFVYQSDRNTEWETVGSLREKFLADNRTLAPLGDA